MLLSGGGLHEGGVHGPGQVELRGLLPGLPTEDHTGSCFSFFMNPLNTRLAKKSLLYFGSRGMATYTHLQPSECQKGSQLPPTTYLLGLDGEVPDDGPSSLVRQLPGGVVADPAMDTTTAREDPDDVLEAEVLCWMVTQGRERGQRALSRGELIC